MKMINPFDVKLDALPWLPLEEKAALPKRPTIYFAIDSQDTVQYIGRTVNMYTRWGNHHRYYQLAAIENIKIAYLLIDTPQMLPDIENALIEYFQPSLNRKYSTSEVNKNNADSVKKRKAITYRLAPTVKAAISESAEKHSRSENQQAEFLLKVGYLHTSGVNINGLSDREIIEKFDELTSELEDSDND